MTIKDLDLDDGCVLKFCSLSCHPVDPERTLARKASAPVTRRTVVEREADRLVAVHWPEVRCETCGSAPGSPCTVIDWMAWATDGKVSLASRPHVARARAAAVLVGCLPPLGG